MVPMKTSGDHESAVRTKPGCCRPAIKPALINPNSGSAPSYAKPRPDGVTIERTMIAARHTGASHAAHFGTPERRVISASSDPARISGMRAHVAKYAASLLHRMAV